MTPPLVSVILPVRDRAAWIARAVTSVLDQTYPAIQLIVVDDGSSDGTRRVLAEFGSRLTVISVPQGGAWAARNQGLRHATGDLVAFIDSDDAWRPDRIARQVPLMEDPAVGLVFGDALCAEVEGGGVTRTGPTCFQLTPPSRGWVSGEFAWGNFVPTLTVLVRRRALEDVGGFSTAVQVSADYLTWFRIALRHRLEYVEGGPVATYSVHADGISQHLGRSLRARIELFHSELDRTTDPAVRETLRRLLFNLSMHLALAQVRGRAHGVHHAARLAWQTARETSGRHMAGWAAAFAGHHLLVRSRRRFAPPLTPA